MLGCSAILPSGLGYRLDEELVWRMIAFEVCRRVCASTSFADHAVQRIIETMMELTGLTEGVWH